MTEYIGKGAHLIALKTQIDSGSFVYKIPIKQKYLNIKQSSKPTFKKKIQYALSDYRELIKFYQQIYLINKLSKQIEFEDYFPNTKVIFLKSLDFKIDNESFRVKGLILLQEFVDFFSNKYPVIDDFDWRELIRIQVNMWRLGFGLSKPAEVWGPKNWGRTKNNQIRVADMGSLTTNFKKIAYCLSDEVLDKRRKSIHRFDSIHGKENIDIYFSNLRQHLCMKNLENEWRKSC